MSRTRDEWLKEIRDDLRALRVQIDPEFLDHSDPKRAIAVALKEARRTQSDLYRMAEEIYGLSADEIDEIHT